MKCFGCYKENVEGYCLKCRKKLFDGTKIPYVLPFNAPQNYNRDFYLEQTKRLSISGAQLKFSLKKEGDQLSLTDEGGQYILKPVPHSGTINNENEAPENEHLTMQIAEKVFKIKTATNALIFFADGQPAYITRRFDVRPDGSKWLQEDFAQLCMKSKNTHGSNYKYTGAYEDIGIAIRKYVAASLPASEVFFKVVMFNYLVSNGDAHLKNFSLIQSDRGDYQLTPAYDLMSTIIHTPNETDTALELFENDYKTDYYQTYGHHGFTDFMDFARKISVQDVRSKRLITEMVSQNEKVAQMVKRSFLQDETKEIYLNNFLEKVKRFKVE